MIMIVNKVSVMVLTMIHVMDNYYEIARPLDRSLSHLFGGLSMGIFMDNSRKYG